MQSAKTTLLTGAGCLSLLILQIWKIHLKASIRMQIIFLQESACMNFTQQTKKGWFPWIFKNLNPTNNMKILEIGCGNGSLWIKNADKIPADCEIILSDISVGMLRDTRRDLSKINRNFLYNSFNCENIPYGDNSFDLVIANHVLFYCDNIDRACSEIRRVLKPDGRFVCSTYGRAICRR